MSIRTNIGRRLGRGLITNSLTALGVLAAVSTAHADRRTGLANNLLIEDKDDIYFFPQLTTTYRNLISLDYGATSNSGNALLTLGNADMAYGVALHRGDILTPNAVNEIGALGDPPSLFANPAGVATIAQPPATFIDLFLATGNLGFRIGLGRGLTSTTDGAGNTAGESNTFLMGEVGWGTGTRGENTRLDLSGALRLDFAGSTDGAGDDLASGTDIGFAGNIRAFVPQDTTMDLGLLGNVSIASNSVTASGAPMEPSSSALGFGLGGGVGPAFRFGAVQVAGYGTLQLGYSSNDPNSEIDNNEQGTINVIIPGVNLATEINLNDWFYVRTGAQYGWNLLDTSGPGDSGTASQAGVFGWNAGLGVVIDNFHFDGALQQGFVTGGPDFIGGTGGGFFAIASLSYNFDALRNGEAPTEQEAAPLAPEPTPEPILAPAPPPGEPAPATPAAPIDANPEAGFQGSAGGSISVGTP